MKIEIPADYFYKGSPAQVLEIADRILELDPATAWDEYIKEEVARVERLMDQENEQ